MNTSAPSAPELPRWGVVKVSGKVVYEGQIDNQISAMYNAIIPASELRILSKFITWDELAILLAEQLDREINEISMKFSLHEKDLESTQPNSSPAQISKPKLTLVKNNADS